MRRALIASVALHVGVAAGLWLTALGRPHRTLPPVYQVSLVSAAEVAPQRTRPEPRPAEPVEEETPEPEPEETVPDPETPAPEEKPKPREERPTPKPGPERETEEGDLPVTLEGKPFPYPWYLQQLVRKVQRNWRPPSNTLKATIHFRIDARGRIGEVSVEESSGNPLFDLAARRAIEAANPLPPLPDEYGGDWLGVYFDFDTNVTPR